MTLSHINNLILDMDGVLWRGETPMPHLSQFFYTLQQQNIRFVLATNNASKTISQYVSKLANFGVTVTPDQILTSAEATGSYIEAQYERETAVYIIGEIGLYEALNARGYKIITSKQVYKGETAPLVVVGFTRQTTYEELAMGSLLVHKGATFIGTNPDVSFPHELGQLPGAGALQALITAATGIQPLTIGKPGPIMFQEAMKRLGSTPENTAMVGDRLSTDIAGGHAAGLHTILVLTGITTPQELANTSLKPDYTFDNITHLAQELLASHS